MSLRVVAPVDRAASESATHRPAKSVDRRRTGGWRTACLLAFLCLPVALLPAQGPDPNPGQLRTLSREELDIVKVLTQQELAWNKGDLESFATGYKDSPEILFVGHQISRGFGQMLADYHKNYPTKDAMGMLSFLDLEPHILDDKYAVVLGRYHLDRGKKVGGPADGIFSLVFEKTEKGWKIIVDHTT
jgi:ketosteroid isomerase-like protein